MADGYSNKTKLILAESYLWDRAERIHMVKRSGKSSNLKQNYLIRHGEHAGLISTLATLALPPDTHRVRGTIDTYPVYGYPEHKNFEHAWVEFPYMGEMYVYDPLYERVVPLDAWREACNPRKVTYEQTLAEIIEKYVDPAYAIKVTESHWVFKAKSDVERLIKDDEELLVFDALQEGNILVEFDGDKLVQVVSFTAFDTRKEE